MKIGERIKQRRLELNLSVDELAKKLRKNRATIYRYESNEIENFPTTTLEPLAKALDTTPAYLMGWEEEDTSKQVGENTSKENIASLAQLYFGDGVYNMLLKYDSLNEIGKKKVRDNIDDLVQIYSSKNHLSPQAAHERIDIEITDDMREHDDDIMDDDAFWNK